jgi:hypothetical protein
MSSAWSAEQAEDGRFLRDNEANTTAALGVAFDTIGSPEDRFSRRLRMDEIRLSLLWSTHTVSFDCYIVVLLFLNVLFSLIRKRFIEYDVVHLGAAMLLHEATESCSLSTKPFNTSWPVWEVLAGTCPHNAPDGNIGMDEREHCTDRLSSAMAVQ